MTWLRIRQYPECQAVEPRKLLQETHVDEAIIIRLETPAGVPPLVNVVGLSMASTRAKRGYDVSAPTGRDSQENRETFRLSRVS